MFDQLLPYVGIMLDIGNVIFFVSNFPQLLRTVKNRKDPKALKGLEERTLMGYIGSTIAFILVGLVTGGILTVILGAANIIIFTTQIYWKRKHYVNVDGEAPIEKIFEGDDWKPE